MKKSPPVIIVSGGSKGLGQAIVTSLLEKGSYVATFSRQATDFTRAMEQGPYSKQFYWESLDMADFSGVKRFVKQISHQWGQLDGLINNAAKVNETILTLQSSDTISQLLRINLEGGIHLTQAAVKQFLLAKQGVIINISSIIGLRGFTGLTVYAATKAAMDGFTRSLARELGPSHIRVNAIAPGYLDTEMSRGLSLQKRQQIERRTPLKRLGTPEDIVGMVDFLLSPSAGFITGQTFVIDGGLTC